MFKVFKRESDVTFLVTAVAFCADCDSAMCGDCQDAHSKMKRFRDHKVEILKGISLNFNINF